MNRTEVSFLLLKTALLSILIALVFLSATSLVVGWLGYRQVLAFTKSSGTTTSELKQLIVTGWNEPVVHTDGRKNILILGVDTIANRGDTPPLTDTIIIASLNITTGQVSMLSLPRDLWDPQYQTRINTLLSYGIERNPQSPTQFPQTAVSEFTRVPIHHTLVVTLDQVAEVIDLLGEVEVEVTTGFVDEQFPRSDVDIKTERDPKKLYETIEFQPGKELMSGERALKYIRSRHAEGDAGTDTARARRQQEVIEALIFRLQQPAFYSQASLIGRLFTWYKNGFNQYLPITQVLATGKALIPVRKSFSLNRQQIDIYPKQPTGSITHPPLTKYNGQWVYEVRDLTAFQAEVRRKLVL